MSDEQVTPDPQDAESPSLDDIIAQMRTVEGMPDYEEKLLSADVPLGYLLYELRAHERAMTEECPSPVDGLALIRAVERHYDPKGKLWSPNVLSGLQLLRIDADEWLSVVKSTEEAIGILATRTSFPIGDFSKEDFILGAVKTMGLEKAAQTEIVSKWLPELLSEGKADFFEALARAIREARERRPDDIQTIMPDHSMRDRAIWTLIAGWTQSPCPHHDFPPFAFWTYDAITEFCEMFFHIDYGREGIRRRISEYGLTFASIAWVRHLQHEREGDGFRLIKGKRRRSVKGHKSDKKP